MKAFIITIFLIVFSATTFAADSTVVKLMQKVIEMKIPSSYKYYYLLDKAENPKGDTYFIEDIKNNPKMDLLKPLNEIQKEIQTDTSSFNWSSYHFQRAKFTDRIHLPKTHQFSSHNQNNADRDKTVNY